MFRSLWLDVLKARIVDESPKEVSGDRGEARTKPES